MNSFFAHHGQHLEAVIVGSGFSGLYSGYLLKKNGIYFTFLNRVMSWGALGIGIATLGLVAIYPA